MSKKCLPSLLAGFVFLFAALDCRAQALSSSEIGKLVELLKRNDAVAALEIIKTKKLVHRSSRQLQQAEKFLDNAKSRSTGDFQRTELRGDTARLFGFSAVALAFYRQALDQIEDHFQRYGNRNSDFYQIAYKAASCAFWLEDYEQSLSLLKYVETNGMTWVKEFGQKKAASLREFLPNQTSVAQRLKFTKEFWLGFPKLAFYADDATAFLEETLKLNPTKEETKQIYVLIRDAAQENENAETTEIYLKKMIAEFPGEDWVAEAVFKTSQFYFGKNDFQNARRWLDWTLENRRNNARSSALALLGLAEVYEKLGDQNAMLKYLKLAAENPTATPTARGIMDTSDTRQVALARLGKHYKSAGDYAEALKYFTEWHPRSWCGTCSAQIHYERNIAVAECLIGLGKEDEALDDYLLPNIKSGAAFGAKIPQLAVAIYEKRNRLADFLAEIRLLVANKNNYAAQTAVKLAEIKIAARNGEIEKLVADLKHRGGYVPSITSDFIRESNWQAVAIAEELAKLGGKEFPALKARYETLAASKTETAFSDRLWIIYALGVSKSKESEIYLQELLAKAKTENASAALDDINFALSLKTAK